MRFIDMENYPRKSHFDFFRAMAYPYVGFTANVEVTPLLEYARGRKGSSFLACLWAAARAANSVPELRQRILGDKILEYDHCNTGHTVALPDETFCNCDTDCRMGLADFLVYGKEKQEEAKKGSCGFTNGEDEMAKIFVSCVPWIAFTQCVQPVPVPGDSNPRIVFGKYVKEGEKILMPLHIQCSHALVDGRHLGKFYEAFEKIVEDVRDGRI